MDSNEDDNEEAIRNKEQEIMDLGEKYKKEGRAQELSQLIRDVRPFLAMISKAKAAKLVRGLVDLFLDMEASTGTEVQLCKVKIFFFFFKKFFLISKFFSGVHLVGCRGEEDLPPPEPRGQTHRPLL